MSQNGKRRHARPDSRIVQRRTSRTNSEVELCPVCKKLEFNKILANCTKPLRDWSGKKVAPLNDLSLPTGCPLFIFFGDVLSLNVGTLPRRRSYYLKAHSITSLFGKAPIEETVIMTVQMVGAGYPVSPSNCLIIPGPHAAVITPNGSPKANTSVVGRVLDPNNIEYDQLQGWLAYCQDRHTECRGKKDRGWITGFRVIDCLERSVVHWDKRREYITLSYVWGSNTTKLPAIPGASSLSLSLEHFGPLPAVVEDAILVVLGLGRRYLWVDRYCIDQCDDDNKHNQIKNMGLIYATSLLTIIGAAGDSADYGLPGVAARSRNVQLKATVGDHSLVAWDPRGSALETSRWSTRGWTYQEALLSRRRLVFTPNQVYFECAGMHCPESLHLPLDELHVTSKERFLATMDFGKLFPRNGVGKHPIEFTDRVAEFYPRQLTYSEDAFDAFQGILSEFASLKPNPVHNLYGIPIYPSEVFITFPGWRHIDRLMHGLLWTGSIRAETLRRPKIPSWTWLGWSRLDNLQWKDFYHSEARKKRLRGLQWVDVSVELEFKQGSVITWNGDMDSVRLFVDDHGPPPILRVQTWTGEFDIPRSRHAATMLSPFHEHVRKCLEDDHPSFWDSDTPEEPKASTSATIMFLLYRERGEPSLLCSEVMLLEQVPGKGHYERIVLLRPRTSFGQLEKEPSTDGSTARVVGGVELQYREIRLG